MEETLPNPLLNEQNSAQVVHYRHACQAFRTLMPGLHLKQLGFYIWSCLGCGLRVCIFKCILASQGILMRGSKNHPRWEEETTLQRRQSCQLETPASSRKGQCEQSQEEPKSVRSRLKVPLRSSLFSPAVIKNTLTNNNVGEERGSSS